ncbi:MAG: hypothetical protein HQL33_09005 [Alphaproteobacteria bacterium]|nr:hypothetical protein [Alphaproteobacteria bacterium]MBF0130118.1 hypothetical protein [Alphaproteobacteria bacterium]
MIYEAWIRHSQPVPHGEGALYRMENRRVEADSEEDAFLKLERTAYDSIACIGAWHRQGLLPFSVETGNTEFFTDVRRPDQPRAGLEPRMG